MDKIFVDEQSIINTYSEKEQFSCKKYFAFLELKRQNPSLGYKKAAKILRISQGSTRWWNSTKNKSIPVPLKTIEKLRQHNLIPFDEFHNHAETIFRMLGVLFGDGGIDIRLNNLAFSSSDFKDIQTWKSDLLKVFPFAENKISIIEGGEYGHSFNIRTFDRSIIRFFVALGAPVGSKIIVEYKLPDYIFNLSDSSKTAFVDGLLASEVSVPQFKQASNHCKRFVNFSISLSKADFLGKQHTQFLLSLQGLLESVGLPTTGYLKKEIHLENIRKDGHRSSPYRILIKTTFDKIICFNEAFPLHYAGAKKQKLQKEINLALDYKQKKLAK